MPSGKFHAHLAEQQKFIEYQMTKNRVAKLMYDNIRAEKKLSQTMRMNEFADQIRQRRQADRDFHEQWTKHKNQLIEEQKQANKTLRENLK